MKITKEMKELSVKDLQAKLEESRKELLKLNVEVASGSNPASPGKIGRTKKTVARILTLLNEKQNEEVTE